MSDEFVDENAPWPLWRPLVGTALGALALIAYAIASPVGRLDSWHSEGLYGQLVGRAMLAYAVLYFPAYSRRGLPWRLGSFALLCGASILGAMLATTARV